jgi:serine/threonine protein kinase
MHVLETGQTLLDLYVIEECVGSGGMGRVHRAHRIDNNQTVAIKEIECHHEDDLEQIRGEAETLRGLSHPALPRVFDFIADVECCYIVMEYVPGRTLFDVIHHGNPPSEATVLGWGRQLCDVLSYLHQRQPIVIFRDLKPSNVMMTMGDRLKVIDFGIAKTMETPGEMTRTILKGTVSPGYSPPEQYSGGTDARSDIYALGATLYVAATRQKPPESLELASGDRQLAEVRSLNPSIGERTAALIHHMLQLRPDQRPQNITAVLAELEKAAAAIPAAQAGLASPSTAADTDVTLADASHGASRAAVGGGAGRGSLWGIPAAVVAVAVLIVALAFRPRLAPLASTPTNAPTGSAVPASGLASVATATGSVPGSPSSAQTSSATATLPDLLEPGRGAGDIQLGEAGDSIAARHPQFRPHQGSLLHGYLSPLDGFMINVNRDGMVNAIYITSWNVNTDRAALARFHTAGGAHVGSSLADIEREFGTGRRTTAHNGEQRVEYDAGIAFRLDPSGQTVDQILIHRF